MVVVFPDSSTRMAGKVADLVSLYRCGFFRGVVGTPTPCLVWLDNDRELRVDDPARYIDEHTKRVRTQSLPERSAWRFPTSLTPQRRTKKNLMPI
jgi:hypothetical protein